MSCASKPIQTITEDDIIDGLQRPMLAWQHLPATVSIFGVELVLEVAKIATFFRPHSNLEPKRRFGTDSFSMLTQMDSEIRKFLRGNVPICWSRGSPWTYLLEEGVVVVRLMITIKLQNEEKEPLNCTGSPGGSVVSSSLVEFMKFVLILWSAVRHRNEAHGAHIWDCLQRVQFKRHRVAMGPPLEFPSRYTQSAAGEVAVARALFENESDWPDELPFERGDILRVIDESPGLEGRLDPDNGWWLCEDKRGNRGFAPANRLQIMQRFDRGFFQVANPLFDDFFMFNGPERHPFAEPFFADRPSRLFPTLGPDLREDLREPVRDRQDERVVETQRVDAPPLRRLSSMNDAFAGVVRNIPIRVQNSNGDQRLVLPEESFRNDNNIGPVRRTVSTGRISPPPAPPTRKYFNVAPPSNQTTPTGMAPPSGQATLTGLAPPPSVQASSSDEDDRKTTNYKDNSSPLREDVVVPITQKEKDSSMDKLAQRLRSLTKPFRSESKKATLADERSPSPSSSGIGLDTTDSTQSDEHKRTSDISSISTSSSDHNGSLSDHNTTDDSGNGSARLQPAPPTRSTIGHNGSISRPVRPDNTVVSPTEHPTSTSVLQTVFDTIDRPVTVRHVPIRKKDPLDELREKLTDWSMPVKVDEDMEKNRSPLWNQIATRVDEPPAPLPVTITRSAAPEEDTHARKRLLLAKMADCMRRIDASAAQIRKYTAAQFWRQPHVLQPNLNPLREACHSVHEALEEFVDCTGRISIDRIQGKAEELRRLVTPLRETKTIVGALRRQLDTSGWKLAVLARDKEQPRTGMDPLEQYVHLAQQIPSDCRALVDWTHRLVPSSSIVFLSLSAPSSTRGVPHNNHNNHPSTSLFPGDEMKRLSTSSTSTITSGDSSTASGPSSILITRQQDRPNRGRVTFADDATPSSRPDNLFPGPSRGLPPHHSSNLSSLPSDTPSTSRVSDGSVIEEDDLESVVSDRDSLYQDYAFLEDLTPTRAAPTRIDRLGEDDRQLVRFYGPQLQQHTDALSQAIEDFLTVVEEHRAPREFVQKGKLIILSAHKLIYIGDSVSQCIRDSQLSTDVRKASDRLCALLKDCVAYTKIAADEYPNVTCMQTMVDSIVGVAKAAHELKLLVQESA